MNEYPSETSHYVDLTPYKRLLGCYASIGTEINGTPILFEIKEIKQPLPPMIRGYNSAYFPVRCVATEVESGVEIEFWYNHHNLIVYGQEGEIILQNKREITQEEWRPVQMAQTNIRKKVAHKHNQEDVINALERAGAFSYESIDPPKRKQLFAPQPAPRADQAKLAKNKKRTENRETIIFRAGRASSRSFI